MTPTTLGFLYPGSSAEDDIPALVQALYPGGEVAAEVVHTSVGEDAHTLDAVRELGEAARLNEGTATLIERNAAVVIWACTSGSFTYGWEGAQRQAQDLSLMAGLPASSTSIAFVNAMRLLGLQRVAVAATYPREVTEAFGSFLTDAGFRIVLVQPNDIFTAAEAGAIGREAVVNMVQRCKHPEAEVVLVPDTALHTVRWLEELETAAGKPVLTANQVSVWEALRLVGKAPAVPGHGALLAAELRAAETR
jgi:maleate cis-trans isomerase